MASSSTCSLGLSAAVAVTESDAEDLLDSPIATGFCFVLALLGLGALFAQRLKQRGRKPLHRTQSPSTQSPSSQRARAPTPKFQPAATAPPPVVAARARTRRRIITLYDVTPGQRPHEYNVGDAAGTRGSALARVARVA